MKIATLCAPDCDWFLEGIESVFVGAGHEVQRHVVTNAAEVRAALEWGDVAWCEFANEIAATASRMGHEGLIVRMHSYEAYGQAAAIDWTGVAHLVVTSHHVLDLAKALAPAIADVATSMIPSAVDTEKLQLQPHGPGTRIGLVAWVRPEKNVFGALQILAALPEEYTLDVAGEMDHPGQRAYLAHAVTALGLTERVKFLGHVKDIAAFWREHDVCLSASLREGHPYNVLEAMACGVRPVVHEYLGAAEQFRPDAVWRTIDEAAAMIADEHPDMLPGDWRAIVEARYSLHAQRDELLALIENVGGKLLASAAAPAAEAGFESQPSTIPLPTNPSTVLCSLSMIALVRNPAEVADLRRAVKSAASAVDETVVVFDDRSVEMHAIPYTHERRKFESFSDQRNRAAALAKGEWLLVLDADDYFQSVGDLRETMEKAPAEADRIECVEITVDENGREIERGTAIVAYRRTRCAWKYRGHNALVGGTDTRLVSSAVMIYRHPWDENGAAHARRTIPLLMADFADDPQDPHAPYFLARAHYMLDDWAEVAKWAGLSIKLAPQSLNFSPAWALLAHAVKEMHGWGKAAEVLDAGIRAWPLMPDLMDLTALFWKNRHVAACRDAANPHLKTSQWSPKNVPAFLRVCDEFGWIAGEKART